MVKLQQPSLDVHGPLVKLHQSLVDVHQSLVKLQQSLLVVHRPLVELHRSLLEVHQPLVDVHGPLVKLQQPTLGGRASAQLTGDPCRPYHEASTQSSREFSRPWNLNGRLLRLYRCHVCDVVVPANTPSHRKVVETRRRRYPFREKAHHFMKDGRSKTTDDPGGVGSEIVREVLVCPSCFEEPSTAEDCGPPVLALAA